MFGVSQGSGLINCIVECIRRRILNKTNQRLPSSDQLWHSSGGVGLEPGMEINPVTSKP